ncbi:3-ketoacyl-ACP reductase [Kriegella aquimaris]|uniref:NAD(P)-dependent dehydrogenase, short-chain alcohol dehydrogenase family n=1 Tax=Kriegella aquimaris TaxID=192904 RepID=A0A1G9Q501_9FLAO|nr:3-ketoacyl-ACP reductase [Kriegella aquimaris]SDM06100.1 NAD(P)-dependent dehydrogenase, short-chain alcohol dehydrogenase family [Kriegella aquimaris]
MIKNVLITGGSRGIGLGIAKELARMGCNLAINGMRSADRVLDVVQELKNLGSEVIYCQGDVSSVADRKRIMETVLSTFGRLDVLVNNAGVGPERRTDLLETTEESYNRVMGINLQGPFFLTQTVAANMIASKSANKEVEACIINISSMSATHASINRGEYCLSKAGMSMMTKLFAARLGEYGIPVYEVRPGIIETDMTSGVLQKYQKLIDEGLTIEPRLGRPEDVGRAVAALVKGDFPYATGQVVMIDGGLTIPRL